MDERTSVELAKNPPRAIHSLMNNENQDNRVAIGKVMDIHRYSSLTRLLRVTAYFLKFLCKLKNRVRKTKQCTRNELAIDLTATEIVECETIWIKTMPASAFMDEIQYLNGRQSSTPPSLTPQFGLFFDEAGTLRCKGRINETDLVQSSKNPILLPSKYQLSDLTIRETHERTKQRGIKDTHSTIPEKFWILRGAIRRCAVCQKFEGNPYNPPANGRSTEL